MNDSISEGCNCPTCVRIRNEQFMHVAGCYCSMCCPPQQSTCPPAAPGQGGQHYISMPPVTGTTIFIPPRETPDEKKAKEIERMWQAVRAASGS